MSNTSGKKSNGNGNGARKKDLVDATEKFEKALNATTGRRKEYILRLYVTGSSPRSLRAIQNLKQFCDEHLHDYDLEIIDIYKSPKAAREEQIIAAPTLIKKLPAPLRRFVGDLSDKQKLLTGLNIDK